MYKLYWSEGTASFAPHAVLEEANLEYELAPVDISAGETRSAEYLSINPTGCVPTLITPEGEILYESAAIILYLADRHSLIDLIPPPDHELRGQTLQSLVYLSNTVQALYRTFYYPDRFTQPTDDIKAFRETATENLYNAWEPVEKYLIENGPYHLQDRFSLADIYLVMLVTWFKPMKELLAKYPAIHRCFDLVVSRPAIHKCLSQQTKISVGGSSVKS